MSHFVRMFVVASVLVAVGAAVAPNQARAGMYTWIICGNGQPYASAAASDRVRAYGPPGTTTTPCFQNNNHVNSAARKNDYTTFVAINAPPQAHISSVSIDAVGNNYAFNRGWGYMAYSSGNTYRCSPYENEFIGASCGDGVSGFSTHGPKSLAQTGLAVDLAYFGIYCRNLNGCDTGTLDLTTSFLSVEVRDEIKPGLALAGDAWTDAALSGSPLLQYVTTDNAAGTMGVVVKIDGDEKVSTRSADSAGCDIGAWHQCPDDTGQVTVPLNGVADGAHAMSVQTDDAVGNSTEQSRSIVVDAVPPTVGPVRVAGTTREGSTLNCAAPVDGQTPRIDYQWSRTASDGSGEQRIAGGTGATHTLSSSDIGKKVLCEVTGTDHGGSASRKSGLTDGLFAGGAVVTSGGVGAADGAGTKVPGGITGTAAAVAAAVAPCTTGVVKSFGTVTNLTRSYSRSRVPLSGRLLGTTGEGRPERTLELTQTVVRAGTATRTKIATVRTGVNGAFRITAPPGPSRALQLVDPTCGSVGPIITERVRGALQAKTTTPRVRNRQTARIKGRALGGYLGRGIPLELQVKVGRQWRDVKHATTNSRGEYKVGYRFLRTYVRYTYRFRVVSRAGGAWPYMPATSKVVKVRVN